MSPMGAHGSTAGPETRARRADVSAKCSAARESMPPWGERGTLLLEGTAEAGGPVTRMPPAAIAATTPCTGHQGERPQGPAGPLTIAEGTHSPIQERRQDVHV